ncbi:hypothetical protein CHS0354_039339 [Potamilus streckersoni]|uniref:Uncharacterized protein n=1 Tax=Potamilus streckersoni TaxID=2493646 RepID=A0AAE0T3I0_9BIVA|nr:hypothetical protein CHS0354_039339 [Potamilus streckersoni]
MEKQNIALRLATKTNNTKRSSEAVSGQKKGGGTLPESGQRIQRLISLTYPCCPPDIRDRLAKDYFLGAVQDKNLKLEIWRHRPNSLQEAIRIRVEWEAFLLASVKQKPVSSACTDYK